MLKVDLELTPSEAVHLISGLAIADMYSMDEECREVNKKVRKAIIAASLENSEAFEGFSDSADEFVKSKS